MAMVRSYLLILAFGLVTPIGAQDQVILNSPAGQPNGLIVWGKFSDTQFSQIFKNQISPVGIGAVGACILIPCKANEVVAFTGSRAPAYTKVFPAWPDPPHTETLSYPPVVNLRVKVWVICADPACLPLTTASRTSIMAKLAGANLLF